MSTEKPGEISTKFLENSQVNTFAKPISRLSLKAFKESLAGKQNVLPESGTICVCGKMASGKNYICGLLEDSGAGTSSSSDNSSSSGWASVDADLLVHEAINHCTEQIKQTFSEEAAKSGLAIVNENGTINRRELGKLLFKNPELLKKQEAIVYPEITKLIEDFMAKHKKTVINATVLYKTPELLSKCSLILYVRAPLLKRFFRVRNRDKLPASQILRRFFAQRNMLSAYKKAGIKILIIDN